MLYQAELHSEIAIPLACSPAKGKRADGPGGAIDGRAAAAHNHAMIDLTKRWPLGLDSRHWPWFYVAVLAGLALLSQLDIWASQGAISWPDSWRAPFFFITDYGLSDWVLIPSLILFLLALLAGFALRDRLRAAAYELAPLFAFIFVGVGLPGLICNLFKRVVGRGRPVEFEAAGAFSFQHFVNDWTFQSFPSGHSATALSLAFVVGFLWPRLFPLFAVLGVVVAISRVPVGAHYPTDVFAGIVVGMLGAYLVRNIFARKGWLFASQPDGHVVRRPLVAVPHLFQRDRA